MKNDKTYMAKFLHGFDIALAIKGTTKAKILKKANLSVSIFSRYSDTKKSSNPRLETLLKISRALEMSIEEVISLPERAERLLKNE